MEDNGSFLNHVKLNTQHGKARPKESQRRKFLAINKGLKRTNCDRGELNAGSHAGTLI